MKVVVLLLWATAASAAPLERFFIMGDGRLSLVNAHTDARVDVRYRREDGTYDDAALASIRRAFRSTGDDSEGKASLRLIEILSYLQKSTKLRPLTVVSGYRSPEYNEDLRAKGVRAAGGSLHTEGLAADIAFPRPQLRSLWMKLRAMDCCGAGYYAKEGFLHVDVGRPRFWEPQTSRVEENLSAGNAKLFARTEFDRYEKGQPLVVTVHALTVPPVWFREDARLVAANGRSLPAIVQGASELRDGCAEVPVAGERLTLRGTDTAVRGRIVLAVCDPRPARTPDEIETNVVEVP